MSRTSNTTPAPNAGIQKTKSYGRDNFILIVALLACLVSLLFNWVGTGYAIKHILEDEAKDRAVRWGLFVKQDLTDLDQIFSIGTLSFVDQHAIQSAVHAGNITRYKIFNADGLIVYASRPEDVGQIATKSYFYEIVKKGQIFVKIDEKDFDEDNKFVSEAYIPVMEDGLFRGAIEVYSDVTERANEMFKFRIWAFVVLCGFTLLLAGLFAIIVIRRKITQEIAEQSQVSEQALKAVNEALEERVSQRTRELELEIEAHLETETELVDAMMKAERANAAKSAFLSSVSHELRTPMNAIMGFTQVLQLSTRAKLDERESENLQHIISNGDQLVGLIDQILALSKLETGATVAEASQFKIDALINECVEEYRAEADRNNITITAGISACSDKTADVDRNCLKQVLLSLISNAIKYNKPGGLLDISCECNAQATFKITVMDTGSGIPNDQYDVIFQSFERLGREGHNINGAGIGLSIAKSLIELINGQIGFESVVGTGSTFWIELPMPERELIAPN